MSDQPKDTLTPTVHSEEAFAMEKSDLLDAKLELACLKNAKKGQSSLAERLQKVTTEEEHLSTLKAHHPLTEDQEQKLQDLIHEKNVLAAVSKRLADYHNDPSQIDKRMAELQKTISNLQRKVDYHHVTFRQDLVDDHIILSVEHLKQFFNLGGGIKTKAVHDVTFQIKEGECFGLVGESGCGKTTTGRSIIRLYDITSGSIYYKGYRISGGTRWNEKEIKWSRIHVKEKLAKLKAEEKDEINEARDVADEDNESKLKAIRQRYETEIAQVKAEEKTHVDEQKKEIKQIKYDNKHVDRKLLNEIQMIFQDPVDSLDPRMTVEDIIQEGLQIQHQTNKALNHQRCVEMLERVGLIADYASRYPHEFSGGQRQRIGIARALVMNPKFLICDEPISALDVSIRAQIINLLNDLKNEMGLTLLFIAHDLSVVKYFCDRIAVMYFGNLVELATSDELFAHPLHPYTKALLSAIPKPDPLSERNRVRKIYNPQKEHDYSQQKPTLREILPGHFILCNDAEEIKYRQEIKDLDSGALVLEGGSEVAKVSETEVKPSETPKAAATPKKTTK
jgi:oligopeptide transport system ATP-binding protein